MWRGANFIYVVSGVDFITLTHLFMDLILSVGCMYQLGTPLWCLLLRSGKWLPYHDSALDLLSLQFMVQTYRKR